MNTVAQQKEQQINDQLPFKQTKRHIYDSIEYKFFIQHSYLTSIIFLTFIGVLIVIVLQVLINSVKFLPINYDTQTINFSRILIVLGFIDYIVFTIAYLFFAICAFLKYKKTIYLVSKLKLILNSLLVAILAYFIWILVILNIIKYTLAFNVIILILFIIIYLCYNNKHE